MTTPLNNISLVWFFIVVFILSLPFYYLIAQQGISTAWMLTLVPLPVALIFTFLEGKGSELKSLFKRYSIKMPNYYWYAPTILIVPAIILLADRVLAIFRDIPAPIILVDLLPTLVILLLVAASMEEFVWMGYVFDRMEEKWNTIGATLILAIAWIIWHLPAYFLLGQYVQEILLFSIFMIGWRFIIVWIYKNTGKSSFVASLVHYAGNMTMFGILLSTRNFEAVGFLGLISLSVVAAIAVVIVIFFWGPELNKFRRNGWLPFKIYKTVVDEK